MDENSTNYGVCHRMRYVAKLRRVVQRCILPFLLLLLCGTAFAQTPVTGVVSDQSGVMPGVSVAVKGTTSGAVTDINGKYTLNVANGQTLVFTFLGYAPQEVVYNGQKTVNVTLKTNSSTLNEVVVVGYGTQKKATLTGSVASVSGSEITTTKNENVLNSLTGKVAGLRITQNSAEPGSFDNSFSIRGFDAPLVVIDGVPRDNITRLDPNDIESVSVLKDASAAIYGVRAANGVILVTTKRGKKGSLELNYSGTYGLQVPSGLPKAVGAIDFMTLVNEQILRNAINGGAQLKFSDADFDAYRNGTRKSTDWYTPVIRNSVPQSQHNLNAMGGNENTNYFVSMGITQQDGFLRSDDLNYKRYNLRSNLTTRIAKGLSIDVNINGTMDEKNQPYQDAWWIIRSFWRQVPTQSIYANNTPPYLNIGEVDNTNPVALADADVNGYRRYNNRWLQSQLSATWQIPHVEGLSAKGLFAYDYYHSANKFYQKTYNQYKYNDAAGTYDPTPYQSPALVRNESFERPGTLLQLSLNYDRTFGNHSFTGLLLYEENHRQQDNFYAQRELAIPVDQIFAGNAFNQVGSADQGQIYDYVNKSVVGRINYNYKSKYLAEFSFREDGSSRFSPKKQWGFFPAGSVGWRVSQEDFWKSISPVVNDFKIRASYGKVGDDSALAYQFYTGYRYPSNGDSNQTPPGSVFNGSFVNAVQNLGIANPNLTWFNAETYNLGFDAEAWNGLLGATFNIFRRDRSGLLDKRLAQLPGVVGAELPQENLNSDRTQGFEIELSHRNHIGAFNYNIKGNVSFARTMFRSKISTPAGNSQENWRNNQNNRWSNIYWGFDADGRYANYQDILNSPQFTSRGVVVGDYIYQDWNGDGVINDLDKHPVDYNAAPMTNFGLTLGGSYKGFDFNMVWQGASGVSVSYFEQLNIPLWGGGSALEMFMDRYHTAVPNADPYDPNTAWIPGKYALTGNSANVDSKFNIQDATYVRLKSAELGYNLSPNLLKKVGIKGLRIFATGYNIVTFTGVKFLDPEHPSSTYGYLYPLNKTYSLGVNVKL